MSRILAFIKAYPRRIVLISLLLALAGVWHASQTLKIDANQDNLISGDSEYFQNYLKYLKSFGDLEDIYLVLPFDPEKPELQRKAIQKIAGRIQNNQDLFVESQYRVDPSYFQSHALYLLDDESFRSVTQRLKGAKPVINGFLKVDSVDSWYSWLNQLLEGDSALSFTKPEVVGKLLQTIELLALAPQTGKFTEDALKVWNPTPPESFFDAEGYLKTPKAPLYLVRVLPNKDYTSTEIIDAPLAKLRDIVADVKSEFGVEIGITGRPVLQNDEAAITGKDSERAGIVAGVLVVLFFLLFLRRQRLGLLAVLSLAIGLAWTFGLLALFLNSLSLLSLAVGLILIGLGIDYGIHMILSYAQSGDLEVVFQKTAPAILIGALTSALAFSSAVFTDFYGIQQLGLVIGLGLICCALAQLLVLPALVVWVGKQPPENWIRFEPIARGLRSALNNAKNIRTASLVLLTLGLASAFFLRFDFNLLNLQNQELESVQYAKRLQEASYDLNSMVVILRKDFKPVQNLHRLLSMHRSVSRVESLAMLVPHMKDKRRDKVYRFQQEFLDQEASLATVPTKKSLESLSKRLASWENQAFQAGELNAMGRLSEIRKQLDTLKETESFQSEAFLRDLKDTQLRMRALLQAGPPNLESIPSFIMQRFQGRDGLYGLFVFPKENIWEWSNLEAFLQEMREIAPDVTGAPVTTYESAVRIQQGFALVGGLAVLVVIGLLWSYFRDVKVSFGLLLNLIFSLVLLCLYMWLRDIPIHLANFFALPILIGSGIDHGIHITNAFQKHKTVESLFESVLPAVFLSCMTTILGFGTLSFVSHPGLASLGEILTIGTVFICVTNLVVLPCWLKRFSASS